MNVGGIDAHATYLVVAIVSKAFSSRRVAGNWRVGTHDLRDRPLPRFVDRHRGHAIERFPRSEHPSGRSS